MLGHDQLSLALWCYFRTFAHPFPVKVETLRTRVGSEQKSLNFFRADLKKAMRKVAATVAQETSSKLDWHIDEDDCLCADWP
ncbi:MAG: hypothetical protein J6Z30_04260 [Pyramidobacter sp.]|nr:hypothetical protein [Pyramidobacter sp.]